MNGAVNALLAPFGIEAIAWLTDSRYANLALIITSWWHATSYYMILLLAGLQAVPVVYQEAAAIDGANAVQRLRHVILPLLRPTIVLVVVLSIINGFPYFRVATRNDRRRSWYCDRNRTAVDIQDSFRLSEDGRCDSHIHAVFSSDPGLQPDPATNSAGRRVA